MTWLKAVLLWFPILLILLGNGIVKETTYGTKMPELTAHQILCAFAILLVCLASFLFFRLLPLRSRGEALRIGSVWLLLTMAFEFGAGHFLEGHSWEHLLGFYNILAGRLWGVVLLALFLAPILAYSLHRGSPRSR